MGDYLFYGLATAVVIFSLMAVSLPNCSLNFSHWPRLCST
jgi:hypothetical protein